MQTHTAAWRQRWRFISASSFSAPQSFSEHSLAPEVCGILVPCRAQSSPQLCKFKGFCSQFLPGRWFTAQVVHMSLLVVQLSGKVNKPLLGNAILQVWVSTTPCEHSRYLMESRPMSNLCQKNGACLSPTAREGRQARSHTAWCPVWQEEIPDPSLHPEPGHSTCCQA